MEYNREFKFTIFKKLMLKWTTTMKMMANENPNLISPQLKTSSYLSSHYLSHFEESQDPDDNIEPASSLPTTTENLFNNFVAESFVENYVDESFVERTPQID